MNTVDERRLPGIRFQVVPPTPRAVLPRMDIAAFVGFASCGPLHTPVSVEDPSRFRDIFGADLPLAWDAREGAMGYAHLAPAVEAFFRNGGRRCWVVRVAGPAVREVFPVPGLIDADAGLPAAARARCPGSWPDPLRVGTVLARGLFRVFDFAEEKGSAEGAYRLHLEAVLGQVQPGDLLRLTFGADLVLFLTASRIVPAGRGLRVVGTEGRWFRRRNEALRDPVPARAAWLCSAEGRHPLPPCRVQASGETYEVTFDADAGPAPEPGQVLQIQVDEAHRVAGGDTLWLSAAAVETDRPAGSPPGTGMRVMAREGLWPILRDAARWEGSPDGPAAQAQRLTFELLVWHDQALRARLADLGFSGTVGPAEQDREPLRAPDAGAEPTFSGAPTRFWGRLPTDEVLFRLVDGRLVPPPGGSLEAAVFEPRFPLAGPRRPAAGYVPLGMTERPDPEAARGRVAAQDRRAETTLMREGLADFSAALFLDEELAGTSLQGLPSAMREKAYLRAKPSPLRGLHSLFPLEEVTLLAVPDAVHRGWRYEAPEFPVLLGTPRLTGSTWLPEQGALELTWSPAAGEGPLSYELQEAAEPLFVQPVLRYAGPDLRTRLYEAPACAARLFYRVRARRGNEVSPWSETEAVVVPPSAFDGCAAPLAAPHLHLNEETGGPELRWTSVAEEAHYELEVAADPAFLTARVVRRQQRSEDPGRRHRLDPQRAGVYYRVRALLGEETGPWSNTLFFDLPPGRQWTLVTPAAYGRAEGDGAGVPVRAELLAVHRALLRFCAARGDLMGVLSLPGHYRADDVLAHVSTLTPEAEDESEEDGSAGQHPMVPPLRFFEEPVLSYGALYHPWLGMRADRTQGGGVRLVPPEGAVCGRIAARTLRQGAWVAPANEPLKEVLALEPAIDEADWQRLFAHTVNVVRPDPRGFLLLSADTLSRTADLRPINVRRLLILLRRLALREGNAFVFASNSEDLRRRIHRWFDGLLSDLFQRGAFAGDTPGAAYQVVTDASVNPPEAVDQGRLVVELRVAPSRPLAFLTVRLLQRELEGFTLQEG